MKNPTIAGDQLAKAMTVSFIFADAIQALANAQYEWAADVLGSDSPEVQLRGAIAAETQLNSLLKPDLVELLRLVRAAIKHLEDRGPELTDRETSAVNEGQQ